MMDDFMYYPHNPCSPLCYKNLMQKGLGDVNREAETSAIRSRILSTFGILVYGIIWGQCVASARGEVEEEFYVRYCPAKNTG